MLLQVKTPRWTRVLDALAFALAGLAALSAATGGIRVRTSFVRLSLTSPWRIAVAAVIVAAVRYLVAPSTPIRFPLPVRDDVDERGPEPPAGFTPALFALFAVLAGVMTFPLVPRMRDSLFDPGDPLLNLWTLRWVAHRMVTSPFQLFDANIFWPQTNTLAYSETMIAPGLLTAPLAWIGVGGVFVHNLVLLGGIVASGVGASLLVRALTGSIAGAVVAGIVFAFFPFRFDHAAQLQLQQGQWIPLAMWALHQVVWRGRVGDGIWLGVSVAAQLLSCMYYGMFLALYLPVVAACLLAWRRRLWRSRLPILAAAALTAAILFAPAARAYVAARETVGERSRQENIGFSATWSNYLAAPDTNRLYGRTAARFGGLERNLFPGFAALALAALGLWPPLSAVRLAYAVGLLFAVDLTLGFNGVSYRMLYEFFPPMRALRIPALAIVLVGFSLAVLAGYGAARIRRRAAVAALGGIVLLESFSAPIALMRMPLAPPPIYADLVGDSAPGAPVVELPIIYSRDPRYQDQIYMYYSTFHWRPLLNGYSGFFPPSYLALAAEMRTFPDARALESLRSRGARYVIVHGERLPADEYRRIVAAANGCGCGLTVVSRTPWQGSEITLYRVESPRSRR